MLTPLRVGRALALVCLLAACSSAEKPAETAPKKPADSDAPARDDERADEDRDAGDAVAAPAAAKKPAKAAAVADQDDEKKDDDERDDERKDDGAGAGGKQTVTKAAGDYVLKHVGFCQDGNCAALAPSGTCESKGYPLGGNLAGQPCDPAVVSKCSKTATQDGEGHRVLACVSKSSIPFGSGALVHVADCTFGVDCHDHVICEDYGYPLDTQLVGQQCFKQNFVTCRKKAAYPGTNTSRVLGCQ